MKPNGPPPVEALPDVAWTRVERELWARLDQPAEISVPHRNRRWIWLAVPALAAAAVVLVVVTRQRVPMIEDSRVVSGDAPSAASFGDAHIALDAHSALVMQGDRHTVLLETGAAWFAVGPRGSRPAFEVRAGDAAVHVIGTRFRVSRDGEQVAVVVDHGVVAVDFRGAHVELTAGRSWSSAAPDAVTATAEVPAQPAAVAANQEPPTDPSIEPSIEIDPISTRDRHTRSAAVAPSVPVRCDADCAHYRALTKLEVTRPDVAIKGYLELSQGSGDWAANALYAAGRLAADRHDPRAQTLLGIYLRRFPSGANAKDVTVLLDRLKGLSP